MTHYLHDIAGCFGSVFTERAFSKALKDALPIVNALKKEGKEGALAMLSLAHSQEGLKEIEKYAAHIRKNFKTLYILGTGGSSLTGQALTGLKPFQETVRFITSIDPDTISTLLPTIDFRESFFLVISKSGGTLETLAQASLFLQACEKQLGKHQIKNHFLFISDPKKNLLREMGNTFGIPIMDHHLEVGGRFSIFTNVGLLPAAVAGLDIHQIQKGASQGLRMGLERNSEPLQGALLHYKLMQAGITIAAYMPYIDRLANFTIWVRQIWAESLGKNGKGTTLINASGPLDQHSQLQLWLDGPKDKWLSLFTLDTGGNRLVLDTAPDILRNKTLGDLLAAEQEATCQSLIRRGVPVRTFTFKKLDEAALGALATHMILEVLFTARLLGINPLGQPTVEEGKRIARELLQKS